MASTSNPDSWLAEPDSRPLVVTLVVAGTLLICVLGGLNALVVLVNGSTRIDLVESAPQNRIEMVDPGSEWMAEPENPELVVLERFACFVYLAVAIAGFTGAIGLLRRRTWSRALLWTTIGVAIGTHALYVLRVLQIQTAEIANVFERQEVFQLMAMTSLINVAIQSIPLMILAGLLRHSALRRTLFDSDPDMAS